MAELPPCNFWMYENDDSGWQHSSYGRGFLEGITADYTVWAKKPFWSAHEAASLSFCLDPNETEYVVDCEDLPLTNHYAMLVDIIERAQAANRLSDPIRPREYLAWALQDGVDIPDGLRDEIEKLDTVIDAVVEENKKLKQENDALKDDINSLRYQLHVQRGRFDEMRENLRNPAHTDGQLGAKERTSMCKLIYGMSTKKYHYDPNKNKQSAAALIETALREAGVSLDQGTILKYLKLSADACSSAAK
jgi:regulator of replication initiation timing